MTSSRSLFTTLVKINVMIRLFVGPAIFLSPIVATIGSILSDIYDGELFKRSGYARPQYSIYDKILDYYWYIWVLLYVLLSGVPGTYLFIALFAYRTIGQLLFFWVKKGVLLFLFPNIFELVFFYYLVSRLAGQEGYLMHGTPLAIATVVLSIIAIIREYIIHIKLVNISASYLGPSSYWPKVTVNTYKVFIFFSLLLTTTLVLTQFLTSKTRESQQIRARKTRGDGTVISYDPSGKLLGMTYAPVDQADVLLYKKNAQPWIPLCKETNIHFLQVANNKDSPTPESYVFTYSDICLSSLPDGIYSVIISANDTNTQDRVIEFEIYHGLLRR